MKFGSRWTSTAKFGLWIWESHELGGMEVRCANYNFTAVIYVKGSQVCLRNYNAWPRFNQFAIKKYIS